MNLVFRNCHLQSWNIRISTYTTLGIGYKNETCPNEPNVITSRAICYQIHIRKNMFRFSLRPYLCLSDRDLLGMTPRQRSTSGQRERRTGPTRPWSPCDYPWSLPDTPCTASSWSRPVQPHPAPPTLGTGQTPPHTDTTRQVALNSANLQDALQ